MSAAELPDHVPATLVFDVDLFSLADSGADIHTSLSKLIGEYPDIFYTPRHGGHWIVTRQELISTVVTQSGRFSTRQMQIPPIEPVLELLPLTLDPPESTPYRVILMRRFARRAIGGMAEEIRSLTRQLLDKIIDQDAFEFVRPLGAGLPVSVFMNLMGLPLSQFDEFRALAMEYFSLISDERRQELYGRIDELMRSLIVSRQEFPKDDLISELASSKVGDRDITFDELNRMANLLFMAGMDTVANAAAFTFYYLAKDSKLQAKLARNPDLIADFVEESLRMYGVVNTPRQVRQDTDLGGVSLKEGEMVVALLPLAGRDDRVISDPDVFDLHRTVRTHMIFGGGPHLCVGQHLARLELQILLEEWFSRYKAFELAPGFTPEFRSWLVLALPQLSLKITERADRA